MSGGTFNINIPKKRPGTYINIKAEPQPIKMIQDRGTVIIPALLNWGDSKTIIDINCDSPDDTYEKIGYRITSPDYPISIRESLRKAYRIKLFNLNTGEKATITEGNLTITAKYPGTRGNDIIVVITDNVLLGKDVYVFLSTRKVLEFNRVTKIEDLTSNDSWVLFSGSGDLENNAGLKLEGGTDSVPTNDDILDFIDELEFHKFNTVAFPYESPSLKISIKTMIYNFREHMGKFVQAVVPNMLDADYEGIISVANGVILKNGDILDAAMCTYFIAAATAAASNTESNTQVLYPDALDVYSRKNNSESENLIDKGQIFFSRTDNAVVIENDINSLTSYNETGIDNLKSKDYTKNRVIRVFDTFREDCQRIFKPNRYDNNEEGWGLQESDGKILLTSYKDVNAITDVNFDTDFLVDRKLSVHDSTYFDILLKPVDSSEKLYMSIWTR